MIIRLFVLVVAQLGTIIVDYNDVHLLIVIVARKSAILYADYQV